ncbi:putative acyl-[acyl-carrier-protein] desaturase desA1 [Pedobacter glucosidilyticus]|uniref:Acyl-ACP desaturase n=1 Tax=Pedobacter aquae TaxID=2605747 RepID=A0A5C0VEI8_9SPHI|nr:MULTISPECIES: acyl-ACP desaturase [Pedobacter]KHJ36934.1 putative acyl-[acyl-carrier-protein] desaturase desA1 [Pedobacter glucosidilyticus]QEK50232.1 acyl-ACP desaturase [Pedobacter aquae]
MLELPVGSRKEVMTYLEPFMLNEMSEYLKPVEEMWQPADFLPDSSKETFFEEVKELQRNTKEISYDLLAVLIGDTITEEALPTYESWLTMVDDVSRNEQGGWMKWVRAWTAEENRHGDLLNKYLYLSGRVNMRMMEASTQYLIQDGFDIGTGNDPYRNFIYTSFQEMATNVSHRRVASLAKVAGDKLLSKMCGVIASDEARHAKAYKAFISKAFEVDASEVMIAFEDMMRKKIVMPAHFLREIGVKMGQTFGHFTDAAQRLGVYTALDYVDILKELIVDWKIEDATDLNEAGEKARDYLIRLPDRLLRIADRMKAPSLEYKFTWIL